MSEEYYKLETVNLELAIKKVVDTEGKEIIRGGSRTMWQICQILNEKQSHIEELEHALHSTHGLYASDQEDMSHPFRLDFTKELKLCDNCTDNVHLNCQNYVPKNDMCLKFFQLGISDVSQYDTCAEKIVFNDKDLQKKWSN